MVIEGEAGLMHMYVLRYTSAECSYGVCYVNSTGEPDRAPSKVGVAVTDIATGLYAHGAIMAALLSRQQTGRGVWIDCSLFDSQVSIRGNMTELHVYVWAHSDSRLPDWQTLHRITLLPAKRPEGMGRLIHPSCPTKYFPARTDTS